MSKALGPSRNSSVSRNATKVAEWDSPVSNDISPTVSPAGTVATRRLGPSSSSTKTPREPVTTRNTARSFSPARESCVPPGMPNQSASARSRLNAGSPISSRMAKLLSRCCSDSGNIVSLRELNGASRAISKSDPIPCFILPSRPAAVRCQHRSGDEAGRGRCEKENRAANLGGLAGTLKHGARAELSYEFRIALPDFGLRERPRRERIDADSLRSELGRQMPGELQKPRLGSTIVRRTDFTRVAVELRIGAHRGIHGGDIDDAGAARLSCRAGKRGPGGPGGLEGRRYAAAVGLVEIVRAGRFEAFRRHRDGVVDEHIDKRAAGEETPYSGEIHHVKGCAFGADSEGCEFACERLKPRIVPAIEQEMGPRLAKGKSHLSAEMSGRAGDEGNPAVEAEKFERIHVRGHWAGSSNCSGTRGREASRAARSCGPSGGRAPMRRLASSCASVSMPMTTPSIQSWP